MIYIYIYILHYQQLHAKGKSDTTYWKNTTIQPIHTHPVSSWALKINTTILQWDKNFNVMLNVCKILMTWLTLNTTSNINRMSK